MEQRVGRRGAVVALAVVVGVLVATTALFVVLYVKKQADVSRVAERIGTTDASIAEGNARIAAIRSTVDELGAERSRLTTANAELRGCADAAKASVDAAHRSDKAAFDAAMNKVFANCRR